MFNIKTMLVFFISLFSIYHIWKQPPRGVKLNSVSGKLEGKHSETNGHLLLL